MTLDRRRALALLAAGVLPERLAQAQHQMQAAQTAPANYSLQFFGSPTSSICSSPIAVPQSSAPGGP